MDVPTADLDRVLAIDRRGYRTYLVLGLGILVFGIIVEAIGFMAPLGQGGGEMLVHLGGLAIGTFSLAPLKLCLDRHNQLLSVEMLAQKLRDEQARAKPSKTELQRISSLIWKIYEKRLAS